MDSTLASASRQRNRRNSTTTSARTSTHARYDPLRSHRTFRNFWDYSGGTFIDFWCHIMDVAVWALDLGAPRSVSAMGGRFVVADRTETPDTMEAMLEYPKVLVSFSLRPAPPTGFAHMGGIGCVFEGTEGTLVTNYGTHELWVKGRQVKDFTPPAPSIPDSPGHLREFLDGIKARISKPPATCATVIG